MKEQAIIEVSNLTYRYEKDNQKNALEDISFSIAKGEWVAIIGQNGSGKSTAARLIDGLFFEDGYEGVVKIDGETLGEDNVWDLRKKIGMVFQNPDNQFVGATVEDDVAFGMENQGIPREEMKQRLDEALKAVGMQDFKDREPARLSGGQKQRVALAGVIALRPQIMILDEATSMLDPVGREEIMSVIRELKKAYQLTVLSITHDLDEAALADRILVLSKGKLISDTTASALFSEQANFEEFGLDAPFSSNLIKALKEGGMTTFPEGYMEEAKLAAFLVERLKNPELQGKEMK